MRTHFTFLEPTILIATWTLAPGSALAQDEASAPAADEAAAPAPGAEAAPPERVAEVAKPAKPAECPKCVCPECPPCPPPAPPTPPAPAVQWNAQANGGMLITGGNSQSKSFTLGLNTSRKEGKNRLVLAGNLAYGTSNNTVGTVENGIITEVHREEIVSTNNWATKGRYDRFITTNNTAFVSGLAAADKIAGKSFFGGGQAGYSRQLYEDTMNVLVAELGYDFSYESYVAPDSDSVNIHSVRVFVGETLSLTQETGINASVEALLNVNKETNAINASDGTKGVSPFKDTRFNGKVALTTNLWKSLAFGFSFGFKYDQNPAPRPMPANAKDASWPAEYWSLAYAQRWDTATEATLLYTFF